MLIHAAFFAFVASVVTLVQGQTYTGDGTFFTPAVGSCGISNTAADHIVAVAETTFETYPGAGANPNLNPICGKQIAITYNGISTTATITDMCGGCTGAGDLDMSPAVFDLLADESLGRIHGVTWSYL